MQAAKILLLAGTALCGGFSLFAQTWTQTSAPSNQWYSVASSADGVKLAAACGGFQPIYTSTNSGISWMTNNSPIWVWSSIASSADGNKLVAANINTNIYSGSQTLWGTIYTSTNSGATWTLTSAPVTNWFAVASSADGVKLAAAAGDGVLGFNGPIIGPIYTSTNSGATWAQSSAPGELWSCIASSADGGELIAGATSFSTPSPVYFSTNSGASWIPARLPTNVNWSAVACCADGTTFMAANLPTFESVPPFVIPGAVYISHNRGTTWVSNNLPNTDWQGVALSANGCKAVAMSQDGPIYTSADFGATWISNNVPAQPCSSIASSADGNKLVVAILFFSNSEGGGIYTSRLTPAPSINIMPTNSELMLSWLVPSTNFVLQQSSDLSGWSDLTNTPVLNLTNLQNQITLPLSADSGFYRLKTP